MAGSSVQIIRGGPSSEYLANASADAFRDGIILVVINLEPKQVDTKKSLKIPLHPFCFGARLFDPPSHPIFSLILV